MDVTELEDRLGELIVEARDSGLGEDDIMDALEAVLMPLRDGDD